jgi:hypothetical protein
VDDPLGDTDTPELEPAGTGTEASTSSTDNVVVLDFQPDRSQTLLLDEIAVSLESNGETTVSVNGSVFGPYTGATDVSVEFSGAKVPYGGSVRVLHRSTDGASTTTRAQVTGREV